MWLSNSTAEAAAAKAWGAPAQGLPGRAPTCFHMCMILITFFSGRKLLIWLDVTQEFQSLLQSFIAVKKSFFFFFYRGHQVKIQSLQWVLVQYSVLIKQGNYDQDTHRGWMREAMGDLDQTLRGTNLPMPGPAPGDKAATLWYFVTAAPGSWYITDVLI